MFPTHLMLFFEVRPQAAPRVSPTDQGISLIETMVAVSLLGVALTCTIGVLTNVIKLQDSTLANEVSSITVTNITNLYASASIAEIIAWDAAGNRRLAGTDDIAKSTVTDLVNRQLLSSETGHLQGSDAEQLSRMRFTVGYYRAISNEDQSGAVDTNKPGLWGAQAIGSLLALTESLKTKDDRERYRITDLNDTTQLSEGNPIALMVQVVDVNGETVNRVINQYISAIATPLP